MTTSVRAASVTPRQENSCPGAAKYQVHEAYHFFDRIPPPTSRLPPCYPPYPPPPPPSVAALDSLNRIGPLRGVT